MKWDSFWGSKMWWNGCYDSVWSIFLEVSSKFEISDTKTDFGDYISFTQTVESSLNI